MIDYIAHNTAEILDAFGDHVWLSLLPVLLGVVIALPLGWLTVRNQWLYAPMMNIAGLIYSIPSLALFVILPGILGTKVLSPINIVVALTLYTVALLVRTVADALLSVDHSITQAATALGMRPVRRLFSVEVPIGLPVLLAGLRVATMANISLVSVGAIIGVGGLGALFTRGLQLDHAPPVVLGILLSVLLAVCCDLLIVLFQRLSTPWVRAGGAR
jgi:osmoprotectant transport system permease protein